MPPKIVVCVKQVLDTRVPLEILEDRCQVFTKSPEPIYIVNPVDRCALEAGIRLIDGVGGSVLAMTVGPLRARSALRLGLAGGVEEAIHLVHDDNVELDAWSVALVLAEALRQNDFDLVLCGEKSQDNNAAQVGPALAELLDLPQVTRVVGLHLDLSGGTNQLTAQRLLERGDREVVVCTLPAVLSVSPHINDPRDVPIHRLLAVQDARITELKTADLLDFTSVCPTASPLTRITKLAPPRLRPKKTFTPASSLSAMERIRLLSGGYSKRQSAHVKESPEKAADRIVDFLKEHSVV